MLKHISSTIQKAISGEAAKNDVAILAGFHRIQASPGYREAAKYVQNELQKVGLDAWVESFPADDRTRFWTDASFQEWNCDSATLHLVEPVDRACKLADYREIKTSLIQRSISFDGVVEVVLLEDGLKEEDYVGVDVAGKLVLTKGDVGKVHLLAVEKFGAVGILYYGMRSVPPVRDPMDLPDARQYTSFWWRKAHQTKKSFGFVLSPRQGKLMCDLVRQQAKEGKPPVKVKAFVESQLYDGSIEVVCAVIPGETKKETVVVSHLCHPQPSANDNASGAAAALEAARVLHQLIQNGQLQKPKRGIRFLWVPEFTGSYTYLSSHEDLLPNMITGVNLDMVGGCQKENGSIITLEKPPDCASSFTSDLLEWIRHELYNEKAGHTGLESVTYHLYATTNFSGGSDHVVFSDPLVGVPMVMLGQWPDKFYHTSADTVDHIDPQVLGLVSALTAVFSYVVAGAGQSEAAWLAFEMASKFEAKLAGRVQNAITAIWDGGGAMTVDLVKRQVAYQLDRYKEALATLEQLWDGVGSLNASLLSQAIAFSELCLRRVENASVQAPRIKVEPGTGLECAQAETWERKAAVLVPRRLLPGYITSTPDSRLYEIRPETEKGWEEIMSSRSSSGGTMSNLADYWADGKRTALEIVDLVEMEMGIRDPELIVSRFEMLQEAGLIELVKLSA